MDCIKTENKFIGLPSNERFEISKEMGEAVVRELAPNKLAQTTNSYTIHNYEGKTYLEARNSNNLVEYMIELQVEPNLPITKFDYQTVLEEVIQEKKEYKALRYKGYFVMLLLAVLFIVWIFICFRYNGGF